MTQLWSSQTMSMISRRFWSMQSPLRLQTPACIPPHAIWHAYSLRLKASEKHQISRCNTEKTSTVLQGGKKWEKWGYALCLEGKWEHCFFSKWTFTKTNQIGTHQVNLYLWPYRFGNFLSVVDPKQWHNPSSPCTLSNPTHWGERCSHLITEKAAIPHSHMTQGKW